MPAPEFHELPAPHIPLLVRFYRTHASRNRIRAQARCWVARRGEIIAGLCLTPVEHGHFLTGLLVAPAERQQGIGAQLVRRARDALDGPIWLFCQPPLQAFYARLGFRPAPWLPATLGERLERYLRSKTLVALVSEHPPLATLRIATACLLDDAGRLLIVRKRGSRLFTLPGGKAQAGEPPLQTLRRELGEELHLHLEACAFAPLGHFQAIAANEPGHQVAADVFIARLAQPVQAHAELEQLAWLELDAAARDDLAPLLGGQILPVLRALTRATGGAAQADRSG